MKAKLIKQITVQDPDYANDVTLHVYKEHSGLMFAVETVFDIADDPIISPYGNGEIELDDNSNKGA
jgi:hypothetical protein